MQLTTLHIKDLRNLKEIEHSPLLLSPKFNLFLGKNGSGKTSLLEAIHLLATAQSFRTRYPKEFIHFNADSCMVGGKFEADTDINPGEVSSLQIGVQRLRKGGMSIRINEESCDSISSLAKTFPFQIMHAETFRLLELPSKFRRQFLDWGMFHVEPQFFSAWQRYHKALKQRNAAIRRQTLGNYRDSREDRPNFSTVTSSNRNINREKMDLESVEETTQADPTGIEAIRIWDSILVDEGSILAENRNKFMESFSPILSEWLLGFLPNQQFSIRYLQGWSQEKSLGQALEASFRQDSFMGYTTQGPHRSDFEILVEGKPAETVLSRGQRKLLISALYLARGAWFLDRTNKQTLYLLDDLNAELDLEACQRLLQGIVELGGQLVVTAVDSRGLENIAQDSSCKMFHVEHGRVK